MNRSVLFILALLSSSIAAFACGYYPYGEDVRMCFFSPKYYNYYWYSQFNYTAAYFDESELKNTVNDSPNDVFWYSYCEGKVPMPSVKEAIGMLDAGSFTPASANSMVRYLYDTKDEEAINYLKFAKNCEPVNGWYDDPWERDVDRLENSRKQLMAMGLRYGKLTKSQEFRRRYAFLTMRLAFYNGDFKTINTIFDSTFAKDNKRDIIYYWALYFYGMGEKNPAIASYYASQVFANAPDKRFVVYRNFDTKLPLEQILRYAKSNKEKADIYVLASIRRYDKALAYIKKAYALDPQNEGVSFLMLREVNKLEDWIYTPYYTLFSPSIEDSYVSNTETVILKRVEEDRSYAMEVLDFVNSIHSNSTFTMQVRAQLELLTKQYGKCLSTIAQLEKRNDAALNQLEIIKALALTASQQDGKAVILDAVKPILLKNKTDQKFVFALARELEYRGNTTDAALLYANLFGEYSDGIRRWSNVYWKDGKSYSSYMDYYTEWFGYLNFRYSPEQMQQLINTIKNNKANDEFSQWKYDWIAGKLPVLYDMLGTKYMRQNKLKEAYLAFNKTGNQYWEDNYGVWERPSFFGNGNQFDKNPFFSVKNVSDFTPSRDVKMNKYTVVQQLMQYLKKAENVKEKDRDYYYFLVANCYYNMTDYGNSWMMRRFNQSSEEEPTGLEDEAEYYECNLAKGYYEKAYATANTDKFKALCLRMIALCEHNRLSHISNDESRHDYSSETLNKYFKELKTKYPGYYEDMTFNACMSLNKYFAARR